MKNLPKDIRNLVTLKFMKKVLFAVSWYSFVSLSLIYYREQLRITMLKISAFYVVLLSVVIGIVLLLPLIALSFHQIFIDRNWGGVIVGKTYKTVFPAQYQMMISYSFFNKGDAREAVTLKIKTDRGIKHVTYSDNGEDADFYYKIGDEVQHYRGLKYLYNKSAENYSDTRICVHCGTLSSSESTSCSKCRHSLIPTSKGNHIENKQVV